MTKTAAVTGEGKAPRDTCVDVWADRRPPDDNGHRQFVLSKKDPRSEQQRVIDAATRKQYNSCQPGTYEEQQGAASEAPRLYIDGSKEAEERRERIDNARMRGWSLAPDEFHNNETPSATPAKPSKAQDEANLRLIAAAPETEAERDRLREQVKELLASRDKHEALAIALFHERDELLAALKTACDLLDRNEIEIPRSILRVFGRADISAIASVDSSRGEALREGRAS